MSGLRKKNLYFIKLFEPPHCQQVARSLEAGPLDRKSSILVWLVQCTTLLNGVSPNQLYAYRARRYSDGAEAGGLMLG